MKRLLKTTIGENKYFSSSDNSNKQTNRLNPLFVIIVFLSMAILASGDLVEIIPVFSGMLAHPVFPYFHETHDLFALMIALYTAHKLSPLLGRWAVVWFLALHVPYFYLTFPNQLPELLRLLVLSTAAFLGTQIIVVRHRLEIRLTQLAEDLETQRAIEHRRADELDTIRRVSQKINSILDPDTLPNELMHEISGQLGYDDVNLWLIDYTSNEVALQASMRPPGKPLLARNLRLKIGEGITGWVAQHDEPLLVNDILLEPRFFGDKEKAPRSEVYVPLKVGGRLIGVLGFQRYAVNAFNQDDLFLAQTLADQVAVALENARLFQEMQLYTNALNSTADAVVITDLDSRVLDVNPSFEQLTGFSRAEAIGQKMSLVKSQHTTLEFYQKMWDQILHEGFWTGEIINRRKNGEEWNSWNTISTIKDKRGHSVAYVGVNRDITTLKQAEAALRRRAEELALVNQVSTVINQPFALADVLTSTLRELIRVLDLDRGAVAIFTETRDHLTVIANYDQGGGSASLGRIIPVHDNPSMEFILHEHRALAVDDVNHDTILGVAAPLLQSIGVQSLLIVPLIVQDCVIGTIGLDSVRGPRHFNQDEIALAQMIAHQAASAIEKARLFEAESTRRAELSALYDLSRSLADAAYDFDTILDLVARYAVETIHVTLVRVGLVEDGHCVVRSAHPAHALDRDLNMVGYRKAIQDLPNCFRAAQQNEPVIFRYGDSELTDAECETLFLGGTQVVCLVPLRVGERVLGLMMLSEVRHEDREPFSPEKIRLARSIGDQAASALRRAELFVELEDTYLQTVYVLANAVDARDTYTADHAQRLASMALAVGSVLNLDPHELEDLRYGAILHDIGKIGIPDAILKKQSRLDPEEWKVMRQHPEIGARILMPIPRLAGAAKIVRHHHERYDGGGYPDGLAGEAIPLGARILTVVDAYSAIVDERIYKPPCSSSDAIEELKRHAGTQFDPKIVKIFLKVLKRGFE